MKSTLPAICAVKLIFSVVFLFSFISCTANNDDSASLAIALPGAASTRSITTEGSIPNSYSSDIRAYEICVRNSDKEMVQKISEAKPGSTITIDKLFPDTYMVSVLAYNTVSGDNGSSSNPITFTYDCVRYYGKTEVELSSGETKKAAITLGTFENTGSYQIITILPQDSEAFKTGQYLNYSCTVTGNGVNFTYTGGETPNSSKTEGTMNCSNLNGIANYYWNQKKETFLEPGLTYTFNVTVIKDVILADDSFGTVQYKGSTTAKVDQSNYGNQTSHEITVIVK